MFGISSNSTAWIVEDDARDNTAGVLGHGRVLHSIFSVLGNTERL